MLPQAPSGNGKGPREGASCRGHDQVERRIKAMGHGQCDKHSPLRGSGASSASAFGMVLANSSFVTLWLTLTLNSVLQKTFNQRWLWYLTGELGGSPRLYGAVDSMASLLGLLSIVVQGRALRALERCKLATALCTEAPLSCGNCRIWKLAQLVPQLL